MDLVGGGGVFRRHQPGLCSVCHPITRYPQRHLDCPELHLGLLDVGRDRAVQYRWLEFGSPALEVRRNMAKAYIGVGLPGSGKTTHLKKFASQEGAVYVCADDIRTEWYGDAGIQVDPGLIWEEVRRRARKALMAGRDVVVDGTNVKPQDRRRMIQACSAADQVVAIWCQAPFRICVERNSARDRVVPDYAMRRMKRQLYQSPPTRSEGFARVLRVQTAG